MRTKAEQLNDLYTSWNKLVELHAKQGQKILELLAHPDATPEQIAQVVPAFRDTRAALRKHKPVVVAALTGSSFLNAQRADRVQRTVI